MSVTAVPRGLLDQHHVTELSAQIVLLREELTLQRSEYMNTE